MPQSIPNGLNLERVRKLAVAFRQAIEKCRSELDYVPFRHFPHGSCGDTCDLLGKFFEQKGVGGWEYVSGRLAQQTHAWLEKDGWIVDITADQFSDAPAVVIVTSDRSWHDRFEVEFRRPYGSTGCSEDTAKQLEAAYDTILENLHANKASEMQDD